LANGDEILFWDYRTEAYPRKVPSFFSQVDLERRYAKRQVRVDPLTKPVDSRIAGRDYQRDCIDTLCRETNAGRRKLLVEMATGTGKTRTAAAFIKRLFETNNITRVLFLVDRITLAKQTEDAFNEHLSDYPCTCCVPAGASRMKSASPSPRCRAWSTCTGTTRRATST
jgi:type I restriction enzyme R subunit